MPRVFTIEYWADEGWYVGRLKEAPGVFSQGETLAELKDNIRDAYRMMMEDGRLELGEDIEVSEELVEV